MPLNRSRHFNSYGNQLYFTGRFYSFILLNLLLILNFVLMADGTQQYRNLEKKQVAAMFADYYEQMIVPKPFLIQKGEELKIYQQKLKQKILECAGLWPLPDRVDLDVHMSEPLDHLWCTVRRIYYQTWPNVYQEGLIYMPKEFKEKPVPAMLCPHGHWPNGNAYPDVQKRCLMFAKMGYIVLAPVQNHYEDLHIGISHQTHMIWGNMRGLDYLQSLPEVDKNRIGIAGASGGGLQAQMMAGLDERIKAATIVGLTCNYREIMAPHSEHCYCNHFPGIMRYTDQPEISTLGLPMPVQYLTMDDFTANFRFDDFPKIQKLYLTNGVPSHVDCVYWPTPHLYDKPKRERTYWWMEKWVKGIQNAVIEPEPEDIQVFSLEALQNLRTDIPENKGFAGLSEFYCQKYYFKTPTISGKEEWLCWRKQMIDALKFLLGEDIKLSSEGQMNGEISSKIEGKLVIERINYPSERKINIPAILVHDISIKSKKPIAIIVDGLGKENQLKSQAYNSVKQLAEEGFLVVLPDIRFFGELNLSNLKGVIDWSLVGFKPACPLGLWGNETSQEVLYSGAWKRNAILWGRPAIGMACTDILAVIESLAHRNDVNMTKIKLINRNSATLGITCVFAAILDARVMSLDIDMDNKRFEGDVDYNWFYRGDLSCIPFILRYGDVEQWMALLADRICTVRNLPKKSSGAKWVCNIFQTLDNIQNINIVD